MATKTIGATGDFTSILDWTTYVKAIGTLTENEVGQLIDNVNYERGAHTDLDFSATTLNGFTISLGAEASVRHNGTYGSGARVVLDSSLAVYYPKQIHISDIEFHNTEAVSNGARGLRNVENATLKRLLVHVDSVGSNCESVKVSINTPVFIESVITRGGTSGISAPFSGATIRNCTALDSAQGFACLDTTLINCVAYNCIDSYKKGPATASNNAGDDGSTPPGTNPVDLTGNPFEADGHTPTEGGQLAGAGTDSGVTLDAANNAFAATPSIGAFEVVSGGGGEADLIVQDSTHTQTAGNVDLTQSHILEITNASHAHTAESVDLNQSSMLEITDASHTQEADNLDLTQSHILTITDATHLHEAYNLDLIQDHILAVTNSSHAHEAENINLIQAHILAIADAAHSHEASNLLLNVVVVLNIADSTHSHTVENILLTQDHQLLIIDALHSLASSNISLIQDHTLIIDAALHSLISDSLNLIAPTDVITPLGRVYVIKSEGRVYIVAADDRVYSII